MKLFLLSTLIIVFFSSLALVALFWSRIEKERKRDPVFRTITKIYLFLVFGFAIFALYRIVSSEPIIRQDFHSITQQF